MVAATALVLLLPGLAAAHAELQTASPADTAVVQGTPAGDLGHVQRGRQGRRQLARPPGRRQRQGAGEGRRGPGRRQADGHHARAGAGPRRLHREVDDRLRRGQRHRPPAVDLHGGAGHDAHREPERGPDRDAGRRPPSASAAPSASAVAERDRVTEPCPHPRAVAQRLGRLDRAAAATSCCRSSSCSSSSPSWADTSTPAAAARPPRPHDPRAPPAPGSPARGRHSAGSPPRRCVAPDAVLGHQLNATYTSRLPLAVYLTGAAIAVGLSFLFVLARDVRATPPVPTGPGHLPPAVIRVVLRVVGLVAVAWIVVQGILGNTSGGVGRAALPVGLRLGRRRARSPRSSDRCGTSSTRSRRSTTWAPGCCAGSASAPGRRPTIRSGSADGPRPIGFVGDRLARAGGCRRWAVDPVRGPRRLHGVHARDDGPVRTRHVALERGDVLGLVPAPRAAGRLRAGGRGRPGPTPLVRERAARAGLVRGGRGARGARRRLDPVRRALADAALLRPVRGPGDARGDRAAVRVAGHPGGRRARADPGRRDRRDRGRAAADRRGLSHRPLPDLPADRRPEHPRRDLRPVPAGLGPVRDGVPRGGRLVAAAGLVWTVQLAAVVGGHMLGAWGGQGWLRPDWSGRSAGGRASAGTCWAPGAGT